MCLKRYDRSQVRVQTRGQTKVCIRVELVIGTLDKTCCMALQERS